MPRNRRKRNPKERVYVYYATYKGPPGIIKLSGVGKITPGKEFPISEKIYNGLRLSDNFDVRRQIKYIEIDKG